MAWAFVGGGGGLRAAAAHADGQTRRTCGPLAVEAVRLLDENLTDAPERQSDFGIGLRCC
jgi:hypothetical protein